MRSIYKLYVIRFTYKLYIIRSICTNCMSFGLYTNCMSFGLYTNCMSSSLCTYCMLSCLCTNCMLLGLVTNCMSCGLYTNYMSSSLCTYCMLSGLCTDCMLLGLCINCMHTFNGRKYVLAIWLTRGLSYKKQKLFPICLCHSWCLVGSSYTSCLFSVLCFVLIFCLFLFVCPRPVSLLNGVNVSGLFILNCSLRFSRFQYF